MSRRKQSRPRHVDNDGISSGLEEGVLNSRPEPGIRNGEVEDVDDPMTPIRKRSVNIDNDEDAVSDEFSPSDGVPSPNGCDSISACDKCGICFTGLSEFIAHKKLCGNRSRILMPYDPPVNGYLQNGYDFRRSNYDVGGMGKDFSDGEYRDEKDDFESMDEDERRNDNGEYDDGEDGRSKSKRRHTNEDDTENEEDGRYPTHARTDESFVYGLKLAMTNSIQSMRERRSESDLIAAGKNDSINDDDNNDERRKSRKGSELDTERPRPSSSNKIEDPAIAWALKAAERGLFGGNTNVTLGPLAATSAAVAQCGEGLVPREPVPEEVNMFRTMLFQLQQQQMMQIQMIQQMRRQLIASGVNPSMLPADMDLNMMSSEGLASVGAAMSGLQNATAAVTRDTGNSSASSRYNGSRSPSHEGRSRDSSPSQSGSPHRGIDRPISPSSGKSSDKDIDRLRELGTKIKEERASVVDIAEKYLSPNKPLNDSPYCKDLGLSTPLTRNPLEILQEKTAASLSSLPLPLGVRSSSSSFDKPAYSSSSLLNSSALFASSPSLSALQKETDALKPSPILPPLSIPMTAEDYKGYIQRGTILERSQYASDDPFFKHKCRFCHKVFGSDSALQIHVRSHTGERPFKCNICGNRFSTKGNLKVHFERHKAKYPHIKMDATPVPEHLDRQPNLLPTFPPVSIPSSVPLPPPISRMPIPPVHHPPSSSPNASTHPPSSHPSPFPPGFGGSFLASVGPGLMPHFGLMPPPRESVMPFPLPLSLSLPTSLGMPLSLGRDSIGRRESPTKLTLGSVETSVIKSPRKESPVSSNRDASPTDIRRPHIHMYHPQHHTPPFYHPFHHEPPPRHLDVVSDSCKSEDAAEESEKEQDLAETRRPRSRHESADSRSPSPVSRKSFQPTNTAPPAMTSPSPVQMPRPSSSQSPRQSPASVISWASLATSQPPLLHSHHPTLFPHPHLPHPHLPPGFPGLGIPLPGPPSSFPLPSPLNPAIPLPSPRVTVHSPFLPPPPPPLPPQISPPPGEGSMFRNSILPTKTIDPSENLEQYMEVQKSETSKLEALVKNIEQKITDPNQCVVCHRVLSCKSALQMHYRIHTGERPFKCKICGRSFTTKGNLKTHMGVHRAKPALRMMHQCPVCHKQFTNVLVLQQHIRAHTGSMHHLPHVPLLPPHMDWAHRPPFGLNRHHPYLPPLHHDSADLPRGHPFSSVHFLRPRSHSMDSDRMKELPSPKKDKEIRNDQSTEISQGKQSDEEVAKDTSRPHSRSSEDGDDKSHKSSALPEPPQERTCHGNMAITKHGFESAFLPPSFGNTPFDAPLAALEERVKAIDSQLSQTSFEKFRNGMGLDSAFFPNPSSLSNGEKNSEFESESASKPNSPASGGEVSPYLFPLMGSFDRTVTTCNICLKTFACKSALDIHYRSHTKQKPFQCDVCEGSFSTKGNLKQHLLTHKIRDIPSSAFDDINDEHGEEDLPAKDSAEGDDDCDVDDDAHDMPDDDYPYDDDIEEGIDEEEIDPDMDPDDDDTGNLTDDFNDPPLSEEASPPKPQDHFQEDNNNVSSFQNHNEDERQESCSGEQTGSDTTPPGSANKSDLQSNMAETKSVQLPAAQIQNLSKTDNADNSKHITSSSNGSHTSGSSSSSNALTSGSNPLVRRPNGPKHQCMTCMKPFSSASALQIHTRTHTGDKPFKCTVCSKAFTTRGNLKVHMGTHMWNNSPSRRGRRMSIEPPFLLSHMPAGFPPRPPPDFFYQYPLPMMNGPDSKMNEISVIQSLSGALPSLPPIPPHLMQGFLPKDGCRSNPDSRTTSESGEPKDHAEKKLPVGELDLSAKVSSLREVSPSRSTSSTPSSSLSLTTHHATSTVSTTASSTPSPSNNKENSSTAALDLRNMRPGPWMWGAFACHHCGQMFPSQESLEHHLRTHHIGKTESPAHTLSKPDSHPPPTAKALLA